MTAILCYTPSAPGRAYSAGRRPNISSPVCCADGAANYHFAPFHARDRRTAPRIAAYRRIVRFHAPLASSHLSTHVRKNGDWCTCGDALSRRTLAWIASG
jgi:hypothetical protein